MTPEERLRQVLRENDDVPVQGDGLMKIRDRLGARRSLRSRLLVPAAALVGVVMVASVAALGVNALDDGGLRPAPAADDTAEPRPSPTASEPDPSPSPPTSGATTSGDGVPVWPFTSDAQAADWEASPGSRPWANDPVQVVQHLLDDFLKLPGTTATGTASERTGVQRVVVKVAGRPVSTVRVEQLGRTTTGPWTVTGATSEDVGITSPRAGSDVASPIQVEGRVSGYDESVRVRLLTTGGTALAEGFAPAGAEQPWTLPLRWASTTWTNAALVAATADGNGGLHALAVSAVRRSGVGTADVPVSGSTLVAVEDGHVVLADALTGATLRQLSYPPLDATDSDPARGGEDGVVWVRTRGDTCTSSVLRASLAEGAAGIMVQAAPRARRLPSLSPGGRSLGWVESECGNPDAASVVVRGPDGRQSTVAEAPPGVISLDVRDDGAALVGYVDRAFVLPEGALSFTPARQLAARSGCTVSAPAWDGEVVTAWERCSDGRRLTRYDPNGVAVSAREPVPDEAVIRRMSIADGLVLVLLADGTAARFSDGRLTPVPGGKRLAQAAW